MSESHPVEPARDGGVGSLSTLNQQLQKVVAQLKTLYHMGHDLAENENWSDALDRFLMMLVGFMEAEGAALLLLSDLERHLAPRSSFHMADDEIDRACRIILAGWRDHPRSSEIHSLESYTTPRHVSCLEHTGPWNLTIIPLRRRSRALGFLLLDKRYRDGFDFKSDFDFLNTLQTIFAEEIANAAYISELRQLSRFNNKVLDNIRSGVITTDMDGFVRYYNVCASDMCPRLREVKSVHFDDLFATPVVGAHAAGGRQRLFDRIMGDASDTEVLEVDCRAGEATFPARLRTAKMFDDLLNGTVVVAIFENLTEQRRLEAELRRNDRLRVLGQVSAGVAHEIRNPLTGIANIAEMLSVKLGDDQQQSRYARAMLEEINRLDGIIRSLLEFARPPKPQMATCTLDGVVKRVHSLLASEAARKGVALSVSVPEARLHCRADAGQITQVLLNVVQNAIQACAAGDDVAVVCAPADGPAGAATVARIEIVDSGPGVPVEVRESLFDPFVTTKARGTGLGLAISQHIIEEHRGTIRCDFLERGTRFSIELPRLELNPAADPATAMEE